jgi:hypothetical protein
MSRIPAKYTVVQHSGFGYGNNPQFAKGLEVRTVSTKADQDTALKAGGVLFDTYNAADEFCDRAMWPDEQGGLDLIPRARGRFSETTIDGLRVYIPATEAEMGASSAPAVS